MFQWNLLTMTFDMQYFCNLNYYKYYQVNIVINKNQTLLSLNIKNLNEKDKYKIEVFSMETGMRISRYG